MAPASWLAVALAATPRPGSGAVRPLACCRNLEPSAPQGASVGPAVSDKPTRTSPAIVAGVSLAAFVDACARPPKCLDGTATNTTCAASRDTRDSSSHRDQPRAGRAWLPAKASAQSPLRRAAEESAAWCRSKAPPCGVCPAEAGHPRFVAPPSATGTTARLPESEPSVRRR